MSTYRPQISQAQIIGNLAEGSVKKAFQSAGFPVEKNPIDYGEDLLVQTSFKGRLDDSRIWVQVKGYAGIKNRPAAKKMYFPGAQINRWLGSADLIVLVTWDVKNDIGWYAIPDEKWPQGVAQQTARGNVSVQFESEQVLSQAHIQEIAWKSRLRHINNKISIPMARPEWYRNESHSYAPATEASILVSDLLVAIGLLTPKPGGGWQSTEEFTKACGASVRRMLSEEHRYEKMSLPEVTLHAIGPVLIDSLHRELPPGIMPSALVFEHSIEMLTALVLINMKKLGFWPQE